MNKLELLAKLRKGTLSPPLTKICFDAAEIIEGAQQIRIVVGEAQLPMIEVTKVAERRIYRLQQRKDRVDGLEETVSYFRSMVGSLRASYAETETAMIQFWIGDGDVLAGCVIARKEKRVQS